MSNEFVLAWHVHHGELYEETRGVEGIAERRRYIQTSKPPSERRLRLRLLKLVKNQALLTTLSNARDQARGIGFARTANPVIKAITRAISALHKHECPKCPWTGRTIFPRRKAK